MAEARDRAAWARTWAKMAHDYNLHGRHEEDPPQDPMAFFPWEKLERPPTPGPSPAQEAALEAYFNQDRRQ